MPTISSDGRYVTFVSDADNLVNNDSNERRDAFIHDRQTGTTKRVSVRTGDLQSDGDSFSPSISGDGRYVAFKSKASNLVDNDTNGKPDIFVHDRQTGLTERVNVDSSDGQTTGGNSDWPDISGDGRYVAFRSAASNLVDNDTNGQPDIFVHDRQTDFIE